MIRQRDEHIHAQHGVLFGMPAAGKSVIVADLLPEMRHQFGFRLIVEDGLSHAVLTQTQGCEPTIVNPNGYFVLQKLPRARAVADSYFPLYLMVPSSEATKSKGPWATISPLPVTLVKRPASGFARSRQASASSIFFSAILTAVQVTLGTSRYEGQGNARICSLHPPESKALVL